MSALGAGAASNGHGSTAWAGSWTHLRIDRRSPGYCRVTFDHPPVNTVTATTVAELAELVDLIETDADLNVVVFASANPEFFLSDYGTEGDAARSTWLDLLVRLPRAAPVSIASICGRVRGAGSGFVLACDMRFASRETAVLGPFDVGRGRALELVLLADEALDAEVEALATRLAGLDHDALARAKACLEAARGV